MEFLDSKNNENQQRPREQMNQEELATWNWELAPNTQQKKKEARIEIQPRIKSNIL